MTDDTEKLNSDGLEKLIKNMEEFNNNLQNKLSELVDVFKSELGRLKNPHDISDRLEAIEKIESTFAKFEDKCEEREERMLNRLHKIEKETMELSKSMPDFNNEKTPNKN